MVGELGVPEVENEINPCGGAIVPRFVVERVVENDTLVLLQVLYLVSYSHTSSFNAN